MGHEFEALSGKVIEVALAVHKELGAGFLESIYEGAVKVGLRHRGIAFEDQKLVPVYSIKSASACIVWISSWKSC